MPSSLYAVPPALTAAAALLLGASILIRSRGSRPAVLFFAVTAIVGAWLIGFAILYGMSDPRAALDWARVATVPVAFIPAVTYHFATVETGGGRSSSSWPPSSRSRSPSSGATIVVLAPKRIDSAAARS